MLRGAARTQLPGELRVDRMHLRGDLGNQRLVELAGCDRGGDARLRLGPPGPERFNPGVGHARTLAARSAAVKRYEMFASVTCQPLSDFLK